MKEIVYLTLNEDVELEIKGYYTPEEKEVLVLSNGDPGYPGSASEFEIHDIKIIKGTLFDLIDHLNGTSDLWDYLTDLSVKEIENI
jgi:hypothetical protein